MPLNALQRETLFRNITLYVDNILDASVDGPQKIEWLQLSISDSKTTMEQAIQLLKESPDLMKGLVESVSVPRVVRNHWQTLLIRMASSEPIPEASLQALLSGCNNYNPLLITEMWLFENKINAISEINAIKTNLILLREAYLEMTPQTCDEGVYLRIGQSPFNLDQCGPSPYRGEIQKDIKTLVEDRLRQAAKHEERLQREREEQERARKEMEAVVAQSRSEAETARLAVSEMTEQKTREDFTQAVLSNYRTFESGAVAARPVSVSDILSSHKSFATASKQESSIKSERLLQMQSALNNQITPMMREAAARASKEDAALKQSQLYIDLRVAECCNELLSVQEAIIEEQCGDEAKFNAEEINRNYQRELAATYNRYLQDMITKWMLDRQGWLSGSDGQQLSKAELSALSKQFKETIQDAMQAELKELKAFQVESFKKVSKLHTKVQARKAQQQKKVRQYKEKRDAGVMSLMSAADTCSQFRTLRSYIQNNECNLETFNNAITQLSKITGGLEFVTVAQGGFTLFQYACWGGNLALVQGLLARGAKTDLTDPEGNCILHFAVENDSKAMVEILETLMKQPLFSKINSVLELKNRRGKTLLHIAAAFGNITAVHWIVGKSQQGKALESLNLDVAAKDGMTPLHYAAREGQEAVVEHLLTLGAGRTMKALDNNYPLILAIKHGRLGVAHLFCKHGIWLNSEQIGYLLKMAEGNNAFSKQNIAYCLAVPVVEGLNSLARLPGLAAANQPVVVSTNTAPVQSDVTSPAHESQKSHKQPEQKVENEERAETVGSSVSVPAVEFGESSATQNMLLFDFDYASGTREGAVAAASMPLPAPTTESASPNVTTTVNTTSTATSTTTTATL